MGISDRQYEGFIASIISTVNMEEAVISLLRARGFLIDHSSDGFYLSDNSYPPISNYRNKHFKTSDYDYLLNLLGEWNLGSIDSRGRIWVNEIDMRTIYKFAEGIFPKLPIAPIAPEEMCFIYHSWKYLRSNHFGEKVAVSCLEPYIARYVKAISACGLSTRSSCDGFHPRENSLFIRFLCEPYTLWHKHLWKEYLSKNYRLNWDENFSKVQLGANAFNTYAVLNSAAEYLYDNRLSLRRALNDSVSFITDSLEKHYSQEEIYHMVIAKAKDDLDEVFLKNNKSLC